MGKNVSVKKEYKTLPDHVAFIMDGNGRWAKKHGLPRKAGHEEGVRALKKVVKCLSDYGIKAATFFAFSTENWSRPKDEVDALFSLVEKFSESAGRFCMKNNLKIRFLGFEDGLSESLVQKIRTVEAETAGNSGMIFAIALNYGATEEIVRAAKGAALSGNITKDSFEKHLLTKDLPPLDLLVRTGGEKRLSNFLLYQAAYAELEFVDTLWPDMTKGKIDKILADFEKRNRRFGNVE
ncbi:isoprenyl transferase [Faecalibacterium sp. CAG:1138]|nr:isoprenyl transferase [Faecalibacterium sp. CAG:1138]